MLLLIRDSFVPAFTVLEKTLREKSSMWRMIFCEKIGGYI